ncbi:MAG: hypothetical protein JOZ51_08415 [Chloroflexi bacterium]|nr:hypothetical protein [Chloroflexota bacterium]
MLKRKMLAVIGCMICFAVGFVYASPFGQGLRKQPVIAHGNWVDTSVTVDDQTERADLIVRVQVDSEPKARKLREVLKTNTPGQPVKDNVFITPFTDTKMRVLEVYKGEAGQRIEVMQTGGYLPAEGTDPEIHMEMEGDPIYVKGSEHILFLKDISGDAVHAKGRSLYRTVSPASRYEIQGTQVINHAELPENFVPPTSVAELTEQIRSALSK